MLRNVPIRRKLMVVILLTTLTTLLLMCSIFFAYEFFAFRQTTVHQLSTVGEVIAANSTAALTFDNQDDAREILAALKTEQHVIAAALYDKSGKLFAKYPTDLPESSLPMVTETPGFHFQNMSLVGFQTVAQDENRLGTLYLKYDTGEIMRLWFRDSLVLAVLVLGIAVVVAFLISRKLQKQISRPILSLAETAKVISDRRDYSVRASRFGGDEIGLLTDAFNQMLVGIEERDVALLEENAERKHAEEQLKASFKEISDLKAALDEHAIVAITDAQGKITFVNDKFCAISKYSRGELLGQDHRIINSGFHTKEFIRDLWNTITQGKVWKGEIKNKAKDGSYYWVDTTIVPFLNESGKPYQYVAIRADITERKQAEAVLRQSEERYRTLFDTLIEGFCTIEMIFDAEAKAVNYRFLEVNPAFEKQTGLRNARGKLIRDLVPDLEAHWFETFGKIALTGEPAHFENEARALGRCYDVFAYRIGGSESRKVAVLFNDITERKVAEGKILQLNNQLEQRVAERTIQLEAANKELEAFSYSVSHDLRAPLRAVNGFAEIVLEEYAPKLDESGRRYLERIRNGGQQMGVLIDDLLSFSRLNRQSMNWETVNTTRLVQVVLDEVSSQRDGRQIELHVAELPACHGDAALIKQVWVNLISNAIKYTRGRAPAIIEIGCNHANGKKIYFVRDNGAGFDMQYADKLFGVFQRLHRADEFEGTGVGLAIVQRIVHRHGGSVWADAVEGKGAVFYFTIEGETNHE